MEFYKNIKRLSICGWLGWDFAVGGFVRIQKRGLQIQLNLIFVEFYLNLIFVEFYLDLYELSNAKP